ncbi:ParB/RepB/Spo0J family partition protein [Candidatus Bealeia paramacronuclearis]|uniref:ParB/RepB/Spo0J family partition protein n=1 Tax=Candidatus Bealeia paramacronuclearis TaxID=1921001 RepID=A0ABZ2C5U1_9PROT|nr:ParB/RepB/Spo0J family partition protein [Candidatus Bealeia paramacronuclearis]
MIEDTTKKRVLGRGLAALLGPENEDTSFAEDTPRLTPTNEVSLQEIVPCPDQPRKFFDEDEIIQLAASIKSRGVLQPILVRKHPTIAAQYEIIAGERRYRAAKIAGLTQIPVVVKDITDSERLEIALLENIQRQDLNAIEEAEGYQQLMEKYNYTQENLSEIIGKSRSHIANTLRLLKLPTEAKQLLIDGKITAGHARAILAAENPEDLTEKIVTEGLSVRAAETEMKPNTKPRPGTNSDTHRNEDLIALESYLSTLLGHTTELKSRGTGGEIKIYYRDAQDLDALIQKFNGIPTEDKVGYFVG